MADAATLAAQGAATGVNTTGTQTADMSAGVKHLEKVFEAVLIQAMQVQALQTVFNANKKAYDASTR
jgi:hypothetical protein